MTLLPSGGMQSTGSVPRVGCSRGRKLEKALAVKHVESNIPRSGSRESALLQRAAEWQSPTWPFCSLEHLHKTTRLRLNL